MKSHRQGVRCRAGLIGVLLAAFPMPGALAQNGGKPAPAKVASTEWVKSQRARILDPKGDGSMTGEALFDSVVAYVPVKENGAFREAALTRRATWVLKKAGGGSVQGLAVLFRNPLGDRQPD